MRIATICARGGSRGLPGKNIRLLLGKPLIEWTINQARMSQMFHQIVVSSDSEDILKIARNCGVDVVRRSAELSTDKSDKLSAIRHAVIHAPETHLEHVMGGYNLIVDLDVTSPLRDVEDIIAAIELQESTKCSNVITGTHAHRSPYFNLVEIKGGVASLSKPSSITRRQDCPPCFDMNASIYAWDYDTFMDDPQLFYDDTKLYEMPRERSIDIDEEIDFRIIEMLMKDKVLN